MLRQCLWLLSMASQRRQSKPFGTEVLYKFGGKLVGERMRKSSHVLVTELQFADDATVVGDSRESIVRAAERLVEILSKWGVDNEFSQEKAVCDRCIMWGGGSAANTHQRRNHGGSVKFQTPAEPP